MPIVIQTRRILTRAHVKAWVISEPDLRFAPVLTPWSDIDSDALNHIRAASALATSIRACGFYEYAPIHLGYMFFAAPLGVCSL